ncbi:GTB-binding domain-containing protein [Desulfonema limicola]|uniref:GTB-binding domain-containing protein n=1 Tax=Desulfonema limicola TaxID=45656 RepID=A0A975B937_9BACT|nr:sarcosine oxidase subunit gamma SoxG [Desulfonema limicola]QTA80927.1 GTB-binding domain-containing protein [Desulfonema limicola]
MTDIQRRSPVFFASSVPARTKKRENWNIVLEYENQGHGPWIIDLSHRSRWDMQDKNISDLPVFGTRVPEFPNTCSYQEGILINRMNRTQASIWHLAGENLEIPDDKAFTDISDAAVFLALAGDNIFSIAEKLTDYDFMDPQKQPPFLIQGPFSHVPCQIAVVKRGQIEGFPFSAHKSSLILLTCSRGYARDMVNAVLHAGQEFGIRPAGEDKFMEVLEHEYSTG